MENHIKTGSNTVIILCNSFDFLIFIIFATPNSVQYLPNLNFDKQIL